MSEDFPAIYREAEARYGTRLTNQRAHELEERQLAKREESAVWSPQGAAPLAHEPIHTLAATGAVRDAKARTTNLAELEEGRERLVRDEAKDKSVKGLVAQVTKNI